MLNQGQYEYEPPPRLHTIPEEEEVIYDLEGRLHIKKECEFDPCNNIKPDALSTPRGSRIAIYSPSGGATTTEAKVGEEVEPHTVISF